MSFGFVPLDPGRHAVLLHDWVTRDYARFWGMQSATVEEVAREYERIGADPHHEAWLGLQDSVPAFLMERYSPAHSELRGHYEVLPGDVGMHLLVAPPLTPRSGHTAAVFRAVMEFIFADPQAARVVVEPDVRNTKIHTLNDRMGFRQHRIIALPDKEAWLSSCTRSQFVAATASLPVPLPLPVSQGATP